MKEICDLKVTINEQHTFFLNQSIMCSFSEKLRELVEQEEEEEKKKANNKKKKNKRRSTKRIVAEVELTYFPGGADGFETVSRFCYSSNGRVPPDVTMSPSNICILHSSAHLLGVGSLLAHSEAFLDGLFYWTWDDILASLKTCEPFLPLADSSGLLHKLISSLLAKISAHDSEVLTAATPFPSSPPSPGTPGSTASSASASATKKAFLMAREWWFDDLAASLSPAIVTKILTTVGAYGADNKNLTLTRFLLHYLKSSATVQRTARHRQQEYGGLADTAAHGVVLMGRAAFSCRALFWVLRLVSGSGRPVASRECRQGLERVIGLVLDQATLDDLLVSGHGGGSVYDVNLVVRLVRVFVLGAEEEAGGGGAASLARLKKVGRLVDKYLREISPDQGLNVSRFLGVAESLPDSARDCFDGVYRALDIYIESHPMLSSEDCATLCRCLNYEKLTLEACKDLAKNPRIPPGAAMQALVSQKSKHQIRTDTADSSESARTPRGGAASTTEDEADTASSTTSLDEKDELKLNLQKMQNRVRELEKVCLDMKSQMSIMVKSKPIISRTTYQSRRGVTRFC